MQYTNEYERWRQWKKSGNLHNFWFLPMPNTFFPLLLFCIEMRRAQKKWQWPFELHSLQAANTAPNTNNNNSPNNTTNNNNKKIEFIEIGIINIGSSAQNIQCVIYTLPYQLTWTVWKQQKQYSHEMKKKTRHPTASTSIYMNRCELDAHLQCGICLKLKI